MDGEDNRICHQVRDKGSSFFTRPPASARHDVVIVGGGVSGLAAAYRLQHRDFLLAGERTALGRQCVCDGVRRQHVCNGGGVLDEG